jgi:hypothetical protein
VSDRGEYRAVRRVLLDGPDYQRLPERARHVFLVLKINLGPAGIEVWYPGELVARLSAQTGISAGGVQDALNALEADGWIAREANVVWVIGQLAHDPHVKQSDVKHRKMVQRHVEGLPRLPIVARYVLAHREWFTTDGSPTGGPSQALAWAIEGPSEGHRSTENKPENETEDESLGSSCDEPGRIDGGAAPREAYPAEFDALWSAYPKRAGNNPKRDAFKAWRARLRGGVSAEVLHAGVERYRAWCDREGKTGSEFVMQAVRFLGTGGHFLEPWNSADSRPALAQQEDDAADQAWRDVLDLLPAWQRREGDVAERFRALTPATQRGIREVGGMQAIAEMSDSQRVWRKRDFAKAYHRAAQTPHHAGAA